MTMFGSQWFANPGVTYEIDQSCRFNDDDSAYLYKTPDATNQKTWTFSTWFKIGNLGINKTFLAAGTDGGGTGAGYTVLRISDADEIYFEYYASSAAVWKYVSNQVLRDPGAWYHLVVAVDTTQGTASNRIRIYLNGSEVTSFSTETDPSADTTGNVGANILHRIGSASWGVSSLFDGYMAETIYIDGTQLTPSSFGKTNSTTGQWIPKDVSGLTFGTEGFLFAYQDSSALGDDTSGNGNDFTSSGLAAADQVVDTPTDNYCTLNPLRPPNTNLTFSEGNLKVVSSSGFHTYQGTFQIPATGKWYCEIEAGGTIHGSANWDGTIGIGTAVADEGPTGEATNWQWGNARTTVGGDKYNGSATTLVPASSLTSGSIVMMAIDMDNSKIWWGVDGSWMGTASGDNDGNPATGANPAFDNLSGELFPTGNCEADTQYWNFGQLGFAHTPPTGFNGLYWSNLDDPTIADPSAYVQTTLYTGDGASSLAVNQGGNSTFSPNFVWIKNRSAADGHILTDSVRGATKVVSSDSTAAETTDADTLLSFDSDGFSVGADVNVNTSGEDYVGWQWIEGATPGFDVVSFTGNATNRTISHSVGVAPEFIVVKNLADTDNWAVYHASNTAAPATDYLILNTNAATADDATIWNDTAPTSSVFSVGTSSLTNGNTEAMIAYLWAGVEGFSRFGSYTGNGSLDGPFNWCGFSPSFVILKKSEAGGTAGNWLMQDMERQPYNGPRAWLYANLTNAESGSADNYGLRWLANGFKIIFTDTEMNESGYDYVYMAWADTPFKTATAR